tara:strand:+ start:218 stop:427 length:210 start_codon:yes stop_codon:yes gene_type:complete
MSESKSTVFSVAHVLTRNSVATAAALDLVAKACTAGDETSKVSLLQWISEGDNLKSLRDKIKESAGDKV